MKSLNFNLHNKTKILFKFSYKQNLIYLFLQIKISSNRQNMPKSQFEITNVKNYEKKILFQISQFYSSSICTNDLYSPDFCFYF